MSIKVAFVKIFSIIYNNPNRKKNDEFSADTLYSLNGWHRVKKQKKIIEASVGIKFNKRITGRDCQIFSLYYYGIG